MATSTRTRGIAFRYSIRVILVLVTLFAIFLGGWVSRDSGFGRSIRPYTVQQRFTVSATNNQTDPLQTGLYLKRDDLITFNPNTTDRWSAHGSNGPMADYSGSPGYPARLRLHYQIGSQSGFVTNGKSIQVKANGMLELFCRDDNVQDNYGSIRVDVALASSTKPDSVEPSKAASPKILPRKPGTPAWFAD